MQERQDDVDLAEHPGTRGAEHGELTASQRSGEDALSQPVGGDRHRRLAVAQLEGGRVVLNEHPLALGSDAHRKDLVAIAIDG